MDERLYCGVLHRRENRRKFDRDGRARDRDSELLCERERVIQEKIGDRVVDLIKLLNYLEFSGVLGGCPRAEAGISSDLTILTLRRSNI